MSQQQEPEWNFQRHIQLMAARSGSDHLYPRPDLNNLSDFLRSAGNLFGDSASSQLTALNVPWDIKDSFVVVHDLETGDCRPFGTTKKDARTFTAHDSLTRPSLVFLRGYASPHWLNLIGQKHGVSPELYQRHLDYDAFSSSGRDLCTSPGLPSSSTRVFQLTIPTICQRNIESSYEPEDLQSARQQQLEDMKAYFRHLRGQANLVDSVVRRCLLLSKQVYVVEQRASVEVASCGDSWRAIIWLDNGRDLSESVAGPWLPYQARFAWETHFFPVIVGGDVASAATPSPSNRLADGLTKSSTGETSHIATQAGSSHSSNGGMWKAAQNMCMLPFQYGSNLDRYVAAQDALYALSELFRFAASAEVQFLNFLQKCIEKEISSVDRSRDALRHHYAVPLVNLKYIKTQIALHLQNLAETVTILDNRQWLDWPSATDNETAEKTAVLLLTDFQHLLQRAKALARECEQGMSTLANASVLDESRRSAENAMRVQRLTVLATVFIPLSFVCTVWGMNFHEFGTGNLSLWWWLVTAAPVLLVSVGIYHFERLIAMSQKMLWEAS